MALKEESAHGPGIEWNRANMYRKVEFLVASASTVRPSAYCGVHSATKSVSDTDAMQELSGVRSIVETRHPSGAREPLTMPSRN
jgi:hypothetical protein